MASDESRERLAATIEKKISTSSPQFSDKFSCIYRVPTLLRRHNEKAYTPVVVSVGPLHHNDKRLLPMEPHKLSYIKSFLRHSPTNMNLSSYLRVVKDLETDILRSYADPIHLSSADFIHMVLIDSIFLIELFRRCFDESLVEDDDFIYARRFMRDDVERDIILEENQLPFFVLVKLYRVAFKSEGDLQDGASPSFTHLACEFLNLKKSKIDVDSITKEATSCFHLLHLWRSHYKPSDVKSDRDHAIIDIDGNPVCPTVTTLYAAGVRFQVISPDYNSSNLLDISFDKKKGILKIPKLEVDDDTECLFRNVMAFEVCHYYPGNTYFTFYVYFLDWLINTPEDVRLLAKKGIIVNWLGSDKQVSDIINSLGDDTSTSLDCYTYFDITQQLISHCDKRWNRECAILKQTYLKHSWATMSLIYAIILLLLTLIQSITGIFSIPHVLKGN